MRINRKRIEELEAKSKDTERIEIVIVDKETDEVLKVIKQEERATIRIRIPI